MEGEGFTARVEGDKLIIEIDLKAKGTPSASGKSEVIATSRGNVQFAGVSIDLNVYKKRNSK